MLDSPIFWFIVFFIVIILLAVIFNSLKKTSKSQWQETALNELNKILTSNMELKYQTIELDKLLEYSMKNKFRLDSSLGEILKQKRNQFDRNELNQIWEAHKLRNKLVHDVGFN